MTLKKSQLADEETTEKRKRLKWNGEWRSFRNADETLADREKKMTYIYSEEEFDRGDKGCRECERLQLNLSAEVQLIDIFWET